MTERNFFREDFRRAFLDEIGVIDYAYQPIADYTEDFLRHVDAQRIRDFGFKLVADYSHGLATDTLADILSRMKVDVVPLNARMDETKLAMTEAEFRTNQERMGKIVLALGAHLGVQLDVGGEKIYLVDELGNLIDDITAAALMIDLALFANSGRPVAVPITMPNAFDQIARRHNAHIFRIAQNLHSPMHTANFAGILLSADGAGGFIYPAFQPAIDGMTATVRLLEYLAVRNMPLSKVVAELPPFHLVRESVECPWDMKGTAMRLLINHTAGKSVEKIDGIKIRLSDAEWVHISPNPEKPRFEIVAEAATTVRAHELVAEYRHLIHEIIHGAQTAAAQKKDE